VGWCPSSFPTIFGQGRRDLSCKSQECVYSRSLYRLSKLLIAYFAGFNCTEEENTTSLAALRKRAWLALRAKIDEQTADVAILGKLRAHFEERFRYDEQGVPRVWKPDDDIDGAFKNAKDQVRFFLCVIPVV
jgi:protein SEY1